MPAVGPEVSGQTFAEAEKLMQVELTDAQLNEAAGSWRVAMAPLYERRTGPRKTSLEDGLAPATVWNPVLTDSVGGIQDNKFVRSANDAGPLPTSDREICVCSADEVVALDGETV